MHPMLNPQSEPFDLSDRATKFVTEFNRQWQTLAGRRHKVEAEHARLDAIPPDSFTRKEVEARAANNAAERELIQAELPMLGKLIAEWPDLRRKERAAAYHRAVKAHADAREQVCRKVVEIGFPPEMSPESDFLIYHPTVAAAAEKLHTIDNIRHDEFPVVAVQRQIDTLRERLQRLLARAA